MPLTPLRAGAALGLLVGVFAVPVAAQEDAPFWQLNGFGTLGVVHSSADQADFTPGLVPEEGAGFSDEWSYKVDSRLGLQLTANLAPRVKAVVQVIAEQGYDATFEPRVEWANLAYEATPNLTLRLGRTVLPTFMSSQYRKVGYAIPTVRPAAEVYDLVPVTNSDGIDLRYQTRFSGFNNTVQLLYGQKDTRLPGGFEMQADAVVNIANTLEWRDYTLFASYLRADLTLDDFKPVFDGYRAFGPAGARLAEHYELDDTGVQVFTLGAKYDPGSWFVGGEWAANRSRSFIGDNDGWNLRAGARRGALTAYASYAGRHARGAISDPGLPIPQAAPLNALLNQLLDASVGDQRRAAIGLRWDFAADMDLKLQYERINLRRGTRGLLSNPQPGFDRDEPVSVFSATIDFVF